MSALPDPQQELPVQTEPELREVLDLAKATARDGETSSSTSPADTLPTLAEDLLGAGGLSAIFQQIEWAEAEIEAACARHPEQADRLYHCFTLLQPNTELKQIETEFVYRSHCRELLDRVAPGRGHPARHRGRDLLGAL